MPPSDAGTAVVRRRGRIILAAGAALALLCAWLFLRDSQGVKVQHTTAPAVPQTAAAAPKPGAVTVERTFQVPGEAAGTGVRTHAVVKGQLAEVTTGALDVYDISTGQPRWRYHHPKRRIEAFFASADTIVIVTEASSADSRRWTGLDAATGRTLWTSDDKGELNRVLPTGLVSASGVIPVITTNSPQVAVYGSSPAPGMERPGTVAGIEARTGRTLWKRPVDPQCTVSSPAYKVIEYDPSPESDGSLLTFKTRCGNLHALDPLTGKESWRRTAPDPGAQDIIVRDRLTVVPAKNDTQILNPDGKRLARLTKPFDCQYFCQVAAVRNHAVLADDRTGTVIVNRSSGKVTRIAGDTGYAALAQADGKVYGVSQQLADGLMPAVLGVIDPETGRSRRLPVQPPNFAFIDSHPTTTLHAAGGRLLVRTPPINVQAKGGLQQIPGKAWTVTTDPSARKPLETGGVPASAWPDPCKLAPGFHKEDYQKRAKVTIGSVRIANISCEFQVGESALHSRAVAIRWVAATARDAEQMLTTRFAGGAAIPGMGDQAYKADDSASIAPDQSSMVMRVGRYIVEFPHPYRPGTDVKKLAAAVTKSLRRR